MKLTKLLLNEIVSSNIYDTKCKLTTNDGGSSNYRLCCVLEVSFFQFEFLYNLHLVFVVYVFLCVCVCRCSCSSTVATACCFCFDMHMKGLCVCVFVCVRVESFDCHKNKIILHLIKSMS